MLQAGHPKYKKASPNLYLFCQQKKNNVGQSLGMTGVVNKARMVDKSTSHKILVG